MNRFRTKKRAKDDMVAPRSSEESDQPSLSFRGFRKGKKTQQEEVKKEFDLSKALPSNDDFRTSLLMSNLSARFSMLREQDDPNTKIGKASDDSVLFPKRQSRLADFGFSAGGLSDIAEVESIRGPQFLRADSVASDDADSGKGGSVMARSRPTEGNNLFGGRQKIYKIPASSEGGMSGRALYEDDVALSAFQRWKQAEKQRAWEEKNNAETGWGEEKPDQTRPESPPPVGYNRKRETASTTSSASTMARNSTAATSVASQPASATKDSHPISSAPTSAMTSLAPERSVTRTRRLYEQGFAQNPQEQQPSALSRLESVTRPRPFGARTPDLSLNLSSQYGGSTERLVGSNRTVLAKASAPNLRSTSPPTTGPSAGALGLELNVQTDARLNLGGLPPLSPPISETGEQPVLPILAKDVGKATALGIFQKPSQPYDESQYVQRQIQLQQGRETPAQRHRAESNVASASQGQNFETKPATIETRPAMRDERFPPTPVTDIETPQSTGPNLSGLWLHPEATVERPSDEDHPAFRQSALPTPLSFGNRASGQPSPNPKPPVSVQDSQQPSPDDSPTLGPTPGLSGLVRQHLRSESVDSYSSLCAAEPEGPSTEPLFNPDSNRPSVAAEPGSVLNPGSSTDQDWNRPYYGNSPETGSRRPDQEMQRQSDSSGSKMFDRSSNFTEDETDEFANQLAHARRRVREKLTSYVESDSSRAASPLLPSDPPSAQAQASSNPLGIGMLKPKTSRGSLIDRSRNLVTGQPKGLKVLGIGATTMSSSPQPGRQPFDEKEGSVLETMKEEVAREDAAQESRTTSDGWATEEPNSLLDMNEESSAHPGLRAFRQARRELQKRKELETLARRQASQTAQPSEQPLDQPNATHPLPGTARGPRQRTPSRERRPPPVTYRQWPHSDENAHNSAVAPGPSGGRSRSGSETSGERASSRPPRLRTNTNAGQNDQLGPPSSRSPMLRSPGLPGVDIKGSPIMPPYPYPGRGGAQAAPSPQLDRSRSATNLALHTGRPGLDPHSGQPSPISPMGLPSPYAMGHSPAGTPTTLGPRPRQGSVPQSPAVGPTNGGMSGPPMKRAVDKREISEPTFVMSTSRVPTMALPHQSPQPQYSPQPHQPPPVSPGMGDGGRPYGGPRSRSNSRTAGGAPPVPPINPRRRRDDSGARPAYDDTGLTAPRLPFATQANNSTSSLDYEENRSAFSTSDDENGSRPDQRRRLRKPHPDMQGPPSRPFPGKPRDNSPPFVARGPPASRTVATSNMRVNPGAGLPGGMI